ncbi:MAG: cysteine--tRNA ligase [Hyphomicrobiales bacterium]|nr:MAG: cysteine--tRNA ligase [Hyphomicrobiales bacterium]
MTLTLYNTLSRQKEVFEPLDPANVRVYVCGPTVYDFAHIGNARPAIVFDVLFRLLRHVYGADHVTYVRNLTDVDDKINARALRDYPDLPLNEAIAKVTASTAAQYHEDIAALGCLPPTVEPRATEHIGAMIEMIEKLVASGHAYAADGHVLFDVPSMADYGQLSRRSLDEMQAGARVEVAPYKKDAMDFVLWKPSSAEEPGWDSPWGRGRPGWHIECSAMSWKHLGKVFDIHGGGIDLQFPHHENEVAQSRCCHGTEAMARYWMHNGFLQVEGEKMSKSLGNFITIHDVLADWPGEVARFNMLRTHYRQPIDWTVKGLEESRKVLDGWYDAVGDDVEAGEPHADVVAALSDDLNTPKAIAALHSLRSAGDSAGLKASANLLGLLGETASEWAARKTQSADIDAAAVEALIVARADARKAKDFAEADRLRAELDAMGVVIMDGPQGTTWEPK